MFENTGFKNAAVVTGMAGLRASVDVSVLAGFVQGTRILTPDGLRPVEDLVPGDTVMTCDTGITSVLWTHRRVVRGGGPAAPVTFAPGAMGNEHAVCVAQTQSVMHRSPMAELWFGESEVLVPAKALVNDRDVVVRPCRYVTYHTLLLPRHDLVFADGVMVESLLYGREVAKVMARQGDSVAHPALRQTHAVSVRRVLTMDEARVLFA